MYLQKFGTDPELLRELALTYGPLLIILLIVMLVGKLVLGKLNKDLSVILKERKKHLDLARFLAKNNIQTFTEAWKQYLNIQGNKSFFAFSFLGCTVLMIASAKYLVYNAANSGQVLYDPFMELLPPFDFSRYIFILEYLCVIITVFYISDKPAAFVRAIWTVTALFWLRSLTVTIIPLSPPSEMIFLVDPFAQYFFGEGNAVTNDLFFSGHVSLLMLFYFMVENRWLKGFILVSTIAVGLMLIWQRVHYTGDVLFAPVVTYALVKLIYEGKAQALFHNARKTLLELTENR